jgi:glucose/arabinose dehydrogenase
MSSFNRSATTLVAGLLAFVVLPFTGCSNGNSSDTGTTQGGGPPPSTSLKLQTIRTDLSAPVFLTAPPNDNARLFVVEQGGRIQILDWATGTRNAVPFLNISSLISSGGERGLLGMAFHPDYDQNGQFYVFYTDSSGNPTVARYLRSAVNQDLADQATGLVLVSVPHPITTSNHNGGMLAFGPDGCLYASVGDGGTGGAPAQITGSLLGKILRLNPDDPIPPTACSNSGPNPFSNEVWSYGLRNPFRFSFDRGTNDLYIADVGESMREEVDIATGVLAGRGVNYGWNIMEGSLCFPIGSSCNPTGLTFPVFEYDHSQGGCAIIGGYVYRGSASPANTGTYFYDDLCTGLVQSFRFSGGQATDQRQWPLLAVHESITSFGEDAQGELYLMTLQGSLFRIVPN